MKSRDYPKPFLKWVGGKRQLIQVFNKYLPYELKNGKIKKYIEPFIGGGALLFFLLKNYEFSKVVINDLNKDLIMLYNTIKNKPNDLINSLKDLSDKYFALDENNKKFFYYDIRSKFNYLESDDILKSAYFIFLNKTCFNGLYRVNKKGEFNVPYGKYKNPTILDRANLLSVSKSLQNVTILNGDFEIIEKYVDSNSFVYFDPPYRPLNRTSSFTSYQRNTFDDNEQVRLADLYKRLDRKGAKLMLSNADPTNTDSNDRFFSDLYKNFNIIKVKAKRSINSKAEGRGKINEILVLNYDIEPDYNIFNLERTLKGEIYKSV